MRRKRIPPTGRGKLNLEESQIIICMSKVRNFAELAPNIGLSEFDFYDLYRSTFEKSELGSMKKLLPLHAMAENFGLVSKSMRPKLGAKSAQFAQQKTARQSSIVVESKTVPPRLNIVVSFRLRASSIMWKAYSSKMRQSRFWFAFAKLLRVTESPKPRNLALPLWASTATIKSRKLSRRES